MPADQPERIGAYEILRTIGRGGMGVLYHARDTSRHREVALKVMSADVLEDDAARERFHHEARLAARLQHRNIVKVFEYGQDGDLPFIAMEFLRGQSPWASPCRSRRSSTSSSRCATACSACTRRASSIAT
jgi:serine/threonine protein kinase